MSTFFQIFCLFLVILNLSSCSVYQAASNEGVAVSDIEGCKTKHCLLSNGMTVVDSHVEKDGKYTERYRAIARKSGANYLRAAGHGVLDVATLGLWEIAGTPVEGALSNNRGYVTAKASFASKGADDFIEIAIYDAEGKKVN